MKTIRWFTDSPDPGDPACVCSWCGSLITEEDGPVIRMVDTAAIREARFHLTCAGPLIGLVVHTIGQDMDAFDDWDLP